MLTGAMMLGNAINNIEARRATAEGWAGAQSEEPQ